MNESVETILKNVTINYNYISSNKFTFQAINNHMYILIIVNIATVYALTIVIISQVQRYHHCVQVILSICRQDLKSFGMINTFFILS